MNLKIGLASGSNFILPIWESILNSNGQNFAEILLENKAIARLSNNHLVLDILEKFDQLLENNSDLKKILSFTLQIDLLLTKKPTFNRKKENPNLLWDLLTKKPNTVSLFRVDTLKTENQELEDKLKNLDFLIVASFGFIIPEKLLNLPKYGMVNWHPSKLPRHRGPTPIESTFLAGDKITSHSWIEMTKEMDAGDIILQSDFEINPNFRSVELLDYQVKNGALVWPVVVLLEYLNKQHNLQDTNIYSEFRKKTQNHNLASFSKKISKIDLELELTNETTDSIWNIYRAYTRFFINTDLWGKVAIINLEKITNNNLIDPVYEDNQIIVFKNTSGNLVILKTTNSLGEFCLKINKIVLKSGRQIELTGYKFIKSEF